MWGAHTNDEQDFHGQLIIEAALLYDIGEITLKELRDIIKRFKRRKSPGPDEILMKAYKEMDDECLRLVLELLNEWWRNEAIPEEMLRSRIVLIFKKGNTSDLGNYRPISLLNSMYKMFTAVLQQRIANKTDPSDKKPNTASENKKEQHMQYT